LGQLIFIGLGLYDEMGVSLRGQLEARESDYVFAEFYTNPMPGLRIENLTRMVSKPVVTLSRRDVEERAEATILSKAKSGKVAFLVPGDPMVATTHIDLRLRAQKAGIETRIIHAASIASAAAGATGLQSYKFGRTVTIPATTANELPDSVCIALVGNSNARLHSLVLLEVDVENKCHVTIPQALDRLLAASAKTSSPQIRPETLAIGIARLGAPDMKIRAARVSELQRMEFGEPPHCLVFPATLHFVEAEALQVFCGATKDLVAQSI
jgi:diphthine synthase